jgi:O-antigen ligase
MNNFKLYKLFFIVSTIFKYVKLGSVNLYVFLEILLLIRNVLKKDSYLHLLKALSLNRFIIFFSITIIISVFVNKFRFDGSAILPITFSLYTTILCFSFLSDKFQFEKILEDSLWFLLKIILLSCLFGILYYVSGLSIFQVSDQLNALGLADLNIYDVAAYSADSKRIQGMSSSIHNFSVSLILGFFIAYFNKDRFRFKSYYYATLIIIIFALFLNNTLTAALGILIAFSYNFLQKKNIRKNKRGKIVFKLILILSIPSYFFVTIYLSSYEIESLNTFSARIISWDRGIQMFLDNPIWGVGPGNYKGLLRDYKGFYFNSNYGIEQEPHSIIIALLSQFGILGFVFYSAFVIKSLKINMNAYTKKYYIIARTTLIAILFKSLTGNEFLLLYILMLSTILITGNYLEKDNEKKQK